LTHDFGKTLKTYRKSAKVTGQVLAERLGCTKSYISKIENGLLRPTREYIINVSSALSLRPPEAKGLLAIFDLCETEHHAIPKGQDALAKRQNAILQIEALAHATKSFQSAVVPGLLQTRAYARHVFRYASANRGTLDVAVSRRLARQRILKDRYRQFSFVLSESVLRNRICSSRNMIGQIRHLLVMSALQNISLRLIPWRTALPAIPATGFCIHDDSVVVVDTINGFLTFRSREDVNAYLAAFSEFEGCSITGAEMKYALEGVMNDYRNA